MDRSIQLDQKQFAVWQDEASAAIDRLKDEIWDKATDLAFDNFLDSEEEHIKEAHITDAQRADKLRRLELAKNIKDFNDFRVWALSNQDDWGMIEDGMRSLVDYLPLEDGPLRLRALCRGPDRQRVRPDGLCRHMEQCAATGPQLRPVPASGAPEWRAHDGPGAADTAD